MGISSFSNIETNNLMLGQCGCDIITPSNPRQVVPKIHFNSNLEEVSTNSECYWYALQVLEDAIFTSITNIPIVNADGPNWDESSFSYLTDNSISVPAGTVLYGQFTLLEVASGSVIAYRNNPNIYVGGI